VFIYPWDVWLEIFLTTYLIKFVLTAVGTPFLYAARNFKFEDEADESNKASI
jgi:uncharacterized PurR-regulated membrane protein YhhQ (DUF165 family)